MDPMGCNTGCFFRCSFLFPEVGPYPCSTTRAYRDAFSFSFSRVPPPLRVQHTHTHTLQRIVRFLGMGEALPRLGNLSNQTHPPPPFSLGRINKLCGLPSAHTRGPEARNKKQKKEARLTKRQRDQRGSKLKTPSTQKDG